MRWTRSGRQAYASSACSPRSAKWTSQPRLRSKRQQRPPARGDCDRRVQGDFDMGMGGSGTGKAMSDINVTPMIDVLLVLLIIFMVIVPTGLKGLDTLIPQPPTYKINDNDFAKAALEPKLAEIFAARNEKVMFIKGDSNLDYGKIAEVVDMGSEAGVDHIALITPRIEAGQ